MHLVPSLNAFHCRQISITLLHILAEPADTVTIALSQHNRAHENLNRADALKRHLSFSRGLVEAEDGSQVFFRDGVRVYYTSAQVNAHSDILRSILLPRTTKGVLDSSSMDSCIYISTRKSPSVTTHQCIEFCLGLREPLMIFSVNEENNARNLREIL